MIANLAFATPLLLLALLALPILWWLLRAVPPAPIRRRFPGVALLLGLQGRREPDRQDAVVATAAADAGRGRGDRGLRRARPEPADRTGGRRAAADRDGCLLGLGAGLDGDRTERVSALLDEAGRSARPVSVVALTDLPAGDLAFQSANAWSARLPSITPAPFAPDYAAAVEWVATLDIEAEVFWMADGLAHDGRDDLLDALGAVGPVGAFQSGRDILALSPPSFEDGTIRTDIQRHLASAPRELTVIAHGLDPAGIPRDLARQTMLLEPGETTATAVFDLPPELRNRITRFEIAGERSAGAVTLTDDALQRREVALIDAQGEDEAQALLSPLHYLGKRWPPPPS
jgi:hypothetical protein